MNYYEHHIGDYDEATAHLTACEDGIYSRMIRKYYATERPLVADIPKLQRLLRAKTREEKTAVLSVLEEFFHLEDDGWHQGRCDSAIDKFIASEPEREVKKANEDNRTKRHREERASLFKQLTDAGHHAAWNIGISELRELVGRVCVTPVTPSSNGPVTQPVTAPATPVTATQPPIPNTQLPKEVNHHPGDSTEVGAAQPAEGSPTRVGEICILLRGFGINTSPQALAQHTWPADARVTDELLRTAVAEAKESNTNGRIHVNYLKPIIERLLNPPEVKPPKSDEWAWKKSDQGIVSKGRELGMFARGGESYRDFAARIDDEIRKRKGAAKP